MSLLNSGNEPVTVYPEETTTDPDGNVIVRPATVGTVVLARVQPVSAEEANARGYDTTEVYRLRISRGQEPVLGSEAAVDWRGERYSVLAPGKVHTGSPRTARHVYHIRRA